jgi:hypothetical protein
VCAGIVVHFFIDLIKHNRDLCREVVCLLYGSYRVQVWFRASYIVTKAPQLCCHRCYCLSFFVDFQVRSLTRPCEYCIGYSGTDRLFSSSTSLTSVHYPSTIAPRSFIRHPRYTILATESVTKSHTSLCLF